MTITLPDELAAQMTTLLPEEERDEFAMSAIADALEARRQVDREMERDSAECVVAVNEALFDVQAGRTISFEEETACWQQQKADILAQTGSHTS